VCVIACVGKRNFGNKIQSSPTSTPPVYRFKKVVAVVVAKNCDSKIYKCMLL
jgi:hypothetical protein